MEKNTIEQTTLMTTIIIVDNNTATVKLTVSAFEKIYIRTVISTITMHVIVP